MRRSLNPDYQDPRAYLAAGFFTSDGKTPRPELRAERAAAMGRELLIKSVPLDVVGALAKALALPGAFNERRAWLLSRLQAPSLQRYPTLIRLLQAGAGAVKRPEDLKAFAGHLQRIFILANFERELGRANALSLAASEARAERAQGVRAHRRRDR